MATMCIFGVSGAGKTCFIYAMSQVLAKGAKANDMLFSMRANTRQQQVILDKGYLTLIDEEWPAPTIMPTVYDFNLRMQYQGKMTEVIPNLMIYDYRGGILESDSISDENEYQALLDSFAESVALVYIIDANTLFNALEPDQRHPSHSKRVVSLKDQLLARQQIGIVENLILDFRRQYDNVPPVLIAISKDDVLEPSELENGKELIKEYLPSIFARGSEMFGAITHFSLGVGLDKGIANGKLMLDTSRNLHIPALFGAYAELSMEYEETDDPAVHRAMDSLMREMRALFHGRVDIYVNGAKAKEL